MGLKISSVITCGRSLSILDAGQMIAGHFSEQSLWHKT
jgi:hypothetical protein